MTITTLSKNHGIEGWMRPITDRLIQGDYVVLLANYASGFEFDADAAARVSGKKIVVLDFLEYGVNHSWKNTHLLGVTINEHRQTCEVADFLKLDEWLKRQNVVLYFKREFSKALQDYLVENPQPYPVEPVEIFFDNLPPIDPPNHDEYVNRLGGVFHLFGNSHPDRKELAGAMMARWERICTSLGKITDLVNAKLPFHLVEQIEHLSRYGLGDILHWQSKCMLSLNCPGYGVKAFRMSEVCRTAVPVMPDYGMAYSVPWNDTNCVLLPTANGRVLVDESIAKLETVLRDREDLWNRMVNAHNMAHAYHPNNYTRDQINTKISCKL